MRTWALLCHLVLPGIAVFYHASQVDSLFVQALSLKDPNLQVLLFHQSLQLDPTNVGALNNLGLAFKELGQADSARFYLEKAEQINPIPEVLNNNKRNV